eukprot:6199447-Pleurochrysis_carterae.AAC.2
MAQLQAVELSGPSCFGHFEALRDCVEASCAPRPRVATEARDAASRAGAALGEACSDLGKREVLGPADERQWYSMACSAPQPQTLAPEPSARAPHIAVPSALQSHDVASRFLSPFPLPDTGGFVDVACGCRVMCSSFRAHGDRPRLTQPRWWSAHCWPSVQCMNDADHALGRHRPENPDQLPAKMRLP